MTQIFSSTAPARNESTGEKFPGESPSRMTPPTLEPSPSIENTWDNLLGWGETGGMVIARDMA